MKVDFITSNFYQTNYQKNSQRNVRKSNTSFGNLSRMEANLSTDIGRAIREINADTDFGLSYFSKLSEEFGIPFHVHKKNTHSLNASQEKTIAMLTGEDYDECDDFLEKLMY